MSKLHLSPDLSLPIDAATAAIGLIGQRGVGKSHTETVLVEEFIRAGVPVCVLDPLGVFWGLRSSADGKSAGLPVTILGGEHGDLPLEAGSGKVIANWIVEERRPAVLDLSAFRKGEQRQFATDFAEELYRRNREAFHLVVDEIDLFAPQRPMPGEQRMLGAFEDLVRRGRARGIGITIATQRPAVVHKDILTQVSVLVALRLTGPQDIAAVEAWIRSHGSESERRKVLDSLPSLAIGTAWFWSPGWLEILKKVRIRQRTTFDSSATPKVGAKRIDPKQLAPVDLQALSVRIAATIERAKADDPKLLKARVAELERKLAATAPVEMPPTFIKVPMFDVAAFEELRRDILSCFVRGLNECLDPYASEMLRLEQKAGLDRSTNGTSTSTRIVVPNRSTFVTASSRIRRLGTEHVGEGLARRPSVPSGEVDNGTSMPPGERKILSVIMQSGGRAKKRKVALLSGYAVKGGGFNNYLSSLRSKGWLAGSSELEATDAGRSALGTWKPLPDGPEAVAHWVGSLGKAEGLILQALSSTRGALTKEELAQRAGELAQRAGYKASGGGYKASGGGFNNALSRLRTLELIEGRGELSLAKELR